MLEAMAKRIKNIGDRVEKIGSKISDLETRRTESTQEEPMSKGRIPLEVEARTAPQGEVRRSDSRVKVKVSCYGGSLKSEDLLDWVEELERFFDWDAIADPWRVKFACTKLRGHAALWWKKLQKDRVASKLEKIQTWEEMVVRLKYKFLPIDYH